MKVLVVGSGGREHVLTWKIAQSPMLSKLYAAPGNAGMSEVAECVDIQADDIAGLLSFAKKESIDLTIVGPEAPLVLGIVDAFEEAGLKVFGPNKAASQLEGSKAFAKIKMNNFGVPTANYEAFSNINEAKHYVIEADMPVVIKADGLAAGKGVVICEKSEDAINALTTMMEDGAFGKAGNKVVIEELLTGEEASVLALTDGETIVPLSSSQDHKRAYDNDRGPNTGGMGAYSPCPFLPDEKMDEIINLTVRPIVEGLKKEGIIFKGVVYAGIMLTPQGPKVLEYNCRFGDPEAQVVLPRLKSDLLQLLKEIADGKIISEKLEWHNQACIGVVAASDGYPGAYDKGKVIRGVESVGSSENTAVFHAGTAFDENKTLVTAGGRVLVVSCLGSNLKEAYDLVYSKINQIQFDGCFYRRDIGRKALEVLK